MSSQSFEVGFQLDSLEEEIVLNKADQARRYKNLSFNNDSFNLP